MGIIQTLNVFPNDVLPNLHCRHSIASCFFPGFWSLPVCFGTMGLLSYHMIRRGHMQKFAFDQVSLWMSANGYDRICRGSGLFKKTHFKKDHIVCWSAHAGFTNMRDVCSVMCFCKCFSKESIAL